MTRVQKSKNFCVHLYAQANRGALFGCLGRLWLVSVLVPVGTVVCCGLVPSDAESESQEALIRRKEGQRRDASIAGTRSQSPMADIVKSHKPISQHSAQLRNYAKKPMFSDTRRPMPPLLPVGASANRPWSCSEGGRPTATLLLSGGLCLNSVFPSRQSHCPG